MNYRLTFTAFFIPLFWGCTSTSQEKQESHDGVIQIKTTSFPVDYLVRRLLPNAEVTCIIPKGEDPPDWNPTPETIADLQQATKIIANGAGFEKWMETASLPPSIIIYAEQALGTSDIITLAGEKTHSHGKKGEHSHAGKDPHIWSDPLLYQKQAVFIAQQLKGVADETEIEANLTTLKADLQGLHSALVAATTQYKSVEFAANHPAYNYLAKRYELNVHSFDFDPEEPPTKEALDAFASWNQSSNAQQLLWEEMPSESVQAVFPAGVQHIYIDPLEQPSTDKYDYVQQMKKNITRIKQIPIKEND